MIVSCETQECLDLNPCCNFDSNFDSIFCVCDSKCIWICVTEYIRVDWMMDANCI